MADTKARPSDPTTCEGKISRAQGMSRERSKEKKKKKKKRTVRETKIKNPRQDMNPWLPQNLKGTLCNELYHKYLLRAGPFTGLICNFCVGFSDVMVAYSIADIWLKDVKKSHLLPQLIQV